MSTISFVCSTLAIILSAHSVIFTASTRFYNRRMETLVFDNPEPWYVRYTHWLNRHLPGGGDQP